MFDIFVIKMLEKNFFNMSIEQEYELTYNNLMKIYLRLHVK